MKSLTLSIFLLTVITLSAHTISTADRTFTTVEPPARHEVVSSDSLYLLSTPAAKISYCYSDMYADNSVTVYSDDNGIPFLAIETSQTRKYNNFATDTILLTVDGLVSRRAHSLIKNGQQSQYSAREIKKPETRWAHVLHSSSGINEQLVGVDYDSNGNWTVAHNYYGEYGMDPKPSVTREISYSLSEEEREMANRFASLRADVEDQSPDKSVYIGLLLLALGIAIAIIVTKLDSIGPDTRRYLAGPAVCLLTAIGLYILWQYILSVYGVTWACALCILYVATYTYYHRNIAMKLEDDRTLSNSEATIPIALSVLFLALTGWMIGAETWGTWWSALLTAVFFAIPVVSKPDRGERCDRCHRLGTICKIGEIEQGITTDINEERYTNEVLLVRKRFRHFQSKYRCKSCGNEYTGAKEVKQIEREVLDRKPIAKAPAASRKPQAESTSSQSGSNDALSAHIGCRFYGEPAGGGWPGCLRQGIRYPCDYEDDCKRCPHKILR